VAHGVLLGLAGVVVVGGDEQSRVHGEWAQVVGGAFLVDQFQHGGGVLLGGGAFGGS